MNTATKKTAKVATTTTKKTAKAAMKGATTMKKTEAVTPTMTVEQIAELLAKVNALTEQVNALTEQSAAAEAKAKDAKAKEKEMADRLEAALRKGETDNFDASIKCMFRFDKYAMPGFAKMKTPTAHIVPTIRVNANRLIVREVVRRDMNAMFYLPGKYSSIDSGMYTIKSRPMTDTEIGHYVRQELKRAEYEANRPDFVYETAHRIAKKLPEVDNKTRTRVQRTTGDGGQYKREYDFTDINRRLASVDGGDNKREVVSVARGYMLKENGKPVVRILPLADGFKIATRVNIRQIEVVTIDRIFETLNKYRLADAKQYA